MQLTMIHPLAEVERRVRDIFCPVRNYYVYILANRSRTLYVGVTNDLTRRVFEHKAHIVAGFTHRYRIDRLVHFEDTSDVEAAIARGNRSSRGGDRRR